MSSGHYRLDEWFHKNVGASGVSIALRQGESLFRDSPEFIERILSVLAKWKRRSPSSLHFYGETAECTSMVEVGQIALSFRG